MHSATKILLLLLKTAGMCKEGMSTVIIVYYCLYVYVFRPVCVSKIKVFGFIKIVTCCNWLNKQREKCTSVVFRVSDV